MYKKLQEIENRQAEATRRSKVDATIFLKPRFRHCNLYWIRTEPSPKQGTSRVRGADHRVKTEEWFWKGIQVFDGSSLLGSWQMCRNVRTLNDGTAGKGDPSLNWTVNNPRTLHTPQSTTTPNPIFLHPERCIYLICFPLPKIVVNASRINFRTFA